MSPSAFRVEQGWSQARLAEELGIQSRSYICDLEKEGADWPLGLALRLEQISGGRVPAKSVSSEARNLGAKVELQAAEARP